METPHSQENPTSAQKPDIHLLQQSSLVPLIRGALGGLQMTPEGSQTGDKSIMSPLWVAVFMQITRS